MVPEDVVVVVVVVAAAGAAAADLVWRTLTRGVVFLLFTITSELKSRVENGITQSGSSFKTKNKVKKEARLLVVHTNKNNAVVVGMLQEAVSTKGFQVCPLFSLAHTKRTEPPCAGVQPVC